MRSKCRLRGFFGPVRHTLVWYCRINPTKQIALCAAIKPYAGLYSEVAVVGFWSRSEDEVFYSKHDKARQGELGRDEARSDSCYSDGRSNKRPSKLKNGPLWRAACRGDVRAGTVMGGRTAVVREPKRRVESSAAGQGERMFGGGSLGGWWQLVGYGMGWDAMVWVPPPVLADSGSWSWCVLGRGIFPAVGQSGKTQ